MYLSKTNIIILLLQFILCLSFTLCSNKGFSRTIFLSTLESSKINFIILQEKIAEASKALRRPLEQSCKLEKITGGT